MMELLQIHNDLLFLLSSFIGGGALGGLISTVINHKENKRIKQSEAVQSEAVAKKEDASAATEMMGLLERTVAHTELLQLQRTEDHRRIMGLEKMVEQELAWRKDGDYHYCEVEECKQRRPPIGTFKRIHHG
ncbi:hypothetical protein [Proteiniphilum saccharofermentans]|uniref:hypothetical protein n=1 Tax=Proteiniphilum saccharofermentans TaxID=1642647 RepID=UPI0028B1659F|nr:hypothetical protein [Proteiniphilum saccharofermentans]